MPLSEASTACLIRRVDRTDAQRVFGRGGWLGANRFLFDWILFDWLLDLTSRLIVRIVIEIEGK